MGGCSSKNGGAAVDPPASDGTEVSRNGKASGRRRKRDMARGKLRGRGRGRSRGSVGPRSIGSPRMTELSISSDTIYFDARDNMSEDGPSARLSRGSSYQDGIDDYPNSPMAALAANPDVLLEPDEEPPTCLPRVFSNKDRDREARKFVLLTRPEAGSSLKRGTPPLAATVPEGAPATGASLLPTTSGRMSPMESWEDPRDSKFMVRGPDYPRTKKKIPSAAPFYQLLAVDLYSFDFRLGHIAKHVHLPPPPRLGDLTKWSREERLPPLLVINVQLPEYPERLPPLLLLLATDIELNPWNSNTKEERLPLLPFIDVRLSEYLASLFGKNDGPGASLVYYFGLPEGWTPDQAPNKAALGLLRRFVHNKQESDGTPTRDRLKLIPRVFNVDEWAVTAPLSGTEQALLRRYNDKPLLTRPQQRFFNEPTYMEIDLDVHNYAFLARKAFMGFSNRLSTVIFDNAFVVQGNRPEELPEQVFAAARVSYVDFQRVRPFPADTMEHLNSLEGGSSFSSNG